MSRRKERPGRKATIGEREAYQVRQLERHGEVWRHYRALLDADPDPRRGRVARAEKATASHFGIDRSTVQRKVRAVQPIMDELATAKRAESAASLRAQLELVKRMLERAVAGGRISPETAAEMRQMSIGTVVALLERLGIPRN